MAITYTPKVDKTQFYGSVKYGYITVTRHETDKPDVSLTRHGDISTTAKKDAFIDKIKTDLDTKAVAQYTTVTDYTTVEAYIKTRMEAV